MIKIEISTEMQRRHLEYFQNKIVPNFDSANYDEIFQRKVTKKKNKLKSASPEQMQWFDEFKQQGMSTEFDDFIQICESNAELLAIGDVNVLRTLYDEISVAYNAIHMSSALEQEIYQDVILELFGYERFSKRTSTEPTQPLYLESYCDNQKFDTKWTPYTFVFLSNIRVCPYCNRQYITPILTKDGKCRADLDHFLPKSKYPYFSMSLYNLVPSCKFCNSSLKGDKDFTFDDPNPYCDNFNDYFKFKAEFKSLMEIDLNVHVNTRDKDIKNFLKVFKTEELYKYHKNIAADFIRKKLMWTDNLWTDLSKKGYNPYADQAALKAAMIGYPYCKENINQEALGKLKRDLAEQLDFVKNGNEDVDLIEKLKCIVKEAKRQCR